MIFAAPGTAALAAKAATTTIPIVFMSGVDPVNYGLVASLNRPGGNLTGASDLSVELTPKRLELLHELVPMATTVAFLINPTNPVFPSFNRDRIATETIPAAARSLGLKLIVLRRAVSVILIGLRKIAPNASRCTPDKQRSVLQCHAEQLAALTIRHAVPTIFPNREFVIAGGLESYGSSSTTTYRLAGVYTGRVLRGERPADLPVQQSSRVELVINLKTANALGLAVPQTLLARADEVIE